MESALLNRKFLDDRVAGACIPFVMILALAFGCELMAPVAGLLALVGFLNMGKVGKKQGIIWLLLGFFTCIVNMYHDKGGTWADVLLVYSSSVLLYQSLDYKGKWLSRTWCLRIAVIVAILETANMYMIGVGQFAEVAEHLQPFGIFGSTEAAGLFFAMAALSDCSIYRRYIFCVALGLTGSPLGLLCLGAGLLFKRRDWVMDMLWALVGLFYFICPFHNIWFLTAAFLLWCVPDVYACVQRGSEKWGWIPFIAALLNPWSLIMLSEWGIHVRFLLKRWNWHVFFGIGAGDMLLTGGLFQVMVELGIFVTILLIAYVRLLCRRPTGYAWMIHLIFGMCAFIPAPFLVGAGTGMGDVLEVKEVNSRPYFFGLLVLSIYLCSKLPV